MRLIANLSLRSRLLLGILIPVFVFIAFDTQRHYQNALAAVNVAYDRTLLASAQSIGEQLSLQMVNGQAAVKANVNYSSIEAFQTDLLSRFAYRVTDAERRHIDGDVDLAAWTGKIPDRGPYAALVDFYDDRFRGDAVRVAVLLQPLSTTNGSTMVTIQVAETLELRQSLARELLFETLLSQLVLAAFIALTTLWVVQKATRSVSKLRDQVASRPEGDLSPIVQSDLPLELKPLLTATNHSMAQLQSLLANQKRFVRDTSHQLRTPLAVLKTQVQSALRGDVDAHQALLEISHTVDRAHQLANQMLALAKVSQVAHQKDVQRHDWAHLLREVAVDLSPLIAEKNLNFEIQTTPCTVAAHSWMLKELSRNLLHNAIKFSPPNGALTVTLTQHSDRAVLNMVDEGPGLTPEIEQRLFQPFATSNPQTGTGLGLSICHEIVQSLAGRLRLTNRYDPQAPLGSPSLPSTRQVTGLSCEVFLPLSPPNLGA
jgi:two-component system sensor histidine kinase TctE